MVNSVDFNNVTSKVFDRKQKIKSRIRNKVNKSNFIKKIYSKIRKKKSTTDGYSLADFLGTRFGIKNIIEVGCGSAENLVSLYPRFKIFGVDKKEKIDQCKSNYKFGEWIDSDLENFHSKFSNDVLRNSMVICVNILESLKNVDQFLDGLKQLMEFSPLCLLSTAEGELLKENNQLEDLEINYDFHPWSFSDFEEVLRSKDFNVVFTGLHLKNQISKITNSIAIIEKNNSLTDFRKKNDLISPQNFKVIAIMTVYNEEDIITHSIKNLVNQNIGVYVIDNWSNDETYNLAKKFLGKGLIGIEKFPPTGPSKYFKLESLLSRVEELSQSLNANWFISQDCDEIRKSPWKGLNLRDGIYMVDKAGFNAIDHTVINFAPIDNDFIPGTNFEKHFDYFEFGNEPGHFLQIKAWKNLGIPVSLAHSGGHEISFKARKVYPYKFLLKHYPIRSQSHGEKKVFKERKVRWYKPEVSRGWHVHYEQFKENQKFLRDLSDLKIFDDQFYKKYLVEIISGVGINRQNK